MSTYEDLVNFTIERLAGTEAEPANLALLGVKVTKLPEHRAQAVKLDPADKIRVNVAFSMHQFGTEKEATSLTINHNSQTSDLYILISVAGRNLYGETGVLNILELATRIMLGADFRGLTLSAFSTEILSFETSTWYYQHFIRIQGFEMTGITDVFDEGVQPPLQGIGIKDDICQPVFMDVFGTGVDIENKFLSKDK